MRTTPEPLERPLVLPPKPAPAPSQGETWKPTDTPGIERGQGGKLRTNLPLKGL